MADLQVILHSIFPGKRQCKVCRRILFSLKVPPFHQLKNQPEGEGLLEYAFKLVEWVKRSIGCAAAESNDLHHCIGTVVDQRHHKKHQGEEMKETISLIKWLQLLSLFHGFLPPYRVNMRPKGLFFPLKVFSHLPAPGGLCSFHGRPR